MKKLIIVLSLSLITNSLFAGPGGGGGGIGTLPPNEILMKLPVSKISEVRSKSGYYLRIDDILEGYDFVRGLEVAGDILIIKSQSDINIIVDNDGEEINLFPLH
jgi:hypothetical protein